MVLLAAFGALIHRYTHSDDFLVAAPVLNRDRRPRGRHRLLRQHRRDAACGRSAVRHSASRSPQTRDTAVGAFAHQRVNLDRVVRELNPDRRHGAERMTRVTFGFAWRRRRGLQPAGNHLRAGRAARPLHPAATGLHGRVRRRPASMVEAEHLVEVLDAALARQIARALSWSCSTARWPTPTWPSANST